MTIAGHDALLKREGRYDDMLAAQRQREEERQRWVAELRRAEVPLVEELTSAGFEVESAWDLVNTSTPYPDALPILLRHLERPYPDRVREGIARALAVRDARFAWDTLADLYRREPKGTDAKDGLAVAVAAASDEGVLDDLIELARETRHGTSRVLLLSALQRSKDDRAKAALNDFANDPDIATEARRILRGAR